MSKKKKKSRTKRKEGSGEETGSGSELYSLSIGALPAPGGFIKIMFLACLIFYVFLTLLEVVFLVFGTPDCSKNTVFTLENQLFHVLKKSSFFMTFGVPK